MPDLLQNVLECCGPHERPGVLVRESNELVDGCDQFRHALEDAAPDALTRDLPEPSFDQVEPARAGRDEVRHEARMTFQP